MKARGFAPATAIMDKGYDNGPIHNGCMDRDICPVTPLRQTGRVKAGDANAPTCDHGEWTFAGTDYKRKATKWRCPTGECKPASVWIKADRLHPLIPRHTKRSRRCTARVEPSSASSDASSTNGRCCRCACAESSAVRLHADLTILAKHAGTLARV